MASLIDLTGDDEVVKPRTNPFQYEVNVKLRSLDGGLDRNIFFSDKAVLHEITIGRSSKSADRDMTPQRGNAWIDSPVLSRSHASLFIEPGDRQVVYLKDVGSTHGTKVNGDKIKPFEKRIVKSGDHLSFGTTVLAGRDVYKAKEFEFGYQWDSVRRSPRNLTPADEPCMIPRTFSVPYPSESEDDVSSDNDTNNEDEPPIKDFREHSHLPSVTGNKKRTKLIIDLDKSADDASEVSSDNEGPDSLPIVRTVNTDPLLPMCQQPTSSQRTGPVLTQVLTSDTHQRQSSNRATESVLDKSRDVSGLCSPADSPVEPSSPSYSPSSPSLEPISVRMVANSYADHGSEVGSEIPDVGEYEREQQDWYGKDDEFGTYSDVDDDTENMHDGRYPSGSNHISEGSACTESDDDMSVQIEVSSHVMTENHKKASFDTMHLNKEEAREARDTPASLRSMLKSGNAFRGIERHASPSDAALAKPNHYPSTWAKNCPNDLQIPLTNMESASSHVPIGPPVYNLGAGTPSQADVSNKYREYSQGPFSMANSHFNAEQQPFPICRYPVNLDSEIQHRSMPYYGGDQLVDMELGFSTHSGIPAFGPSVEPTSSWKAQQPENCILDPHASTEKSSKLTISHLMNDAQEHVQPTNETSLPALPSLKRKADEIDRIESHQGRTRNQVTAATDATLASSVDTNEGGCALMENATARCVNEATNWTPCTPSVPEAQLFELQQENKSNALVSDGEPESVDVEPAIKKIKVSSRSTSASANQRTRRKVGPWFRRAATHAFYGGVWAAIGATAAVAALIATVSDDVQQEAFAEF